MMLLVVFVGVLATALLLQDRYGDYAAFSLIFSFYLVLSYMDRRSRLRKGCSKARKSTNGTAR